MSEITKNNADKNLIQKQMQPGKRPCAVLKKGEGRLLRSGGLWIYDNEIDHLEGEIENGQILQVYDDRGYFLGQGFINMNSKIRIRIMSVRSDSEINDDFLRKRLQNAWDYRKKTVDTSSCRIVFGEADFLPGLVIDKYSDVLVVESLALGIDRLKERIVTLLKEILLADGIVIRGVYERSDAKVRLQEGMERVKGFIGPSFDPVVEITENGVKYKVDVENGQKTGFFLDQKYNRQAVSRICKDARVLDCFTHTGSFGLNAAYGGAREVISVDASETACQMARENVRLNGFEDRVQVVCADVFDLLPKMREEGQLFDVVILDPPAFAKSQNAVKNATKGYREINMAGMKLVKDGGYLCTCSCSHFMTYELFTQMIGQAALSCHRRLRQVEYRTQAPDHPILWSASESYYLKFYIFQVCEV